MANIPRPENDDSLELNVRYQPDMVLEGMLDATVPEFTQLTLTMGDDVYDMLGAQTGDQILELLSEDLTSAEDGKVLTVVEDDSGDTPVYNAEWAELPDELPTIAAGDAGKVLSVNAGETGVEWADAPSGLPSIAVADAGKVLTVNQAGTAAAWAEPSGGDSMLEFSQDFTTEVYSYFQTAVGTVISGQDFFDNAWTVTHATSEDISNLQTFLSEGLNGNQRGVNMIGNILYPVLFSGTLETIPVCQLIIPRFTQTVGSSEFALQIAILLAIDNGDLVFTLQIANLRPGT